MPIFFPLPRTLADPHSSHLLVILLQDSSQLSVHSLIHTLPQARSQWYQPLLRKKAGFSHVCLSGNWGHCHQWLWNKVWVQTLPCHLLCGWPLDNLPDDLSPGFVLYKTGIDNISHVYCLWGLSKIPCKAHGSYKAKILHFIPRKTHIWHLLSLLRDFVSVIIARIIVTIFIYVHIWLYILYVIYRIHKYIEYSI